MYQAMNSLIDSSIGEAPHMMDQSAGANARRIKREAMMSILHSLVALSMREGVNRAVLEAREREGARDGALDMADRNAAAQAKDDATRGGKLITLKR